MNPIISAIHAGVVQGNAKQTSEKIHLAIGEGLDAETILNDGLIAAMQEVGRLFEEGEYFVPEMLVSARAMQSGMAILRPILIAQDIKPAGKIVIGTVKGDLHDIGKNLVSMMLEGAGFQIIDLGTDVTPEKFLEAVRQNQPDIVGMSALLTTTMLNMSKTIQVLKDGGVRDGIKIIVGGAPVTEKYAGEIGADGFSPDASQAAALARRLMGLTA